MSDATVSTSELLSGAYTACTAHVIAVVGEEIHRDLLASSREAVLPYVPPLKAITARNGSLAIAEAGDREVFAVAMWLQQYLREIRAFMVGIPPFDVRDLTADIREDLAAVGFYDYFEQAQDLKY